MGLVPLIQDIKENVINAPEELTQMLEYLMISALELDEVIKSITDKTQTGSDDV